MCKENRTLNLLGKVVIPFSNSATFISGPYPTQHPVLVPYANAGENKEQNIHPYVVVKNPYVKDGETFIHICSPVTGNTYEVVFSERLFDTSLKPESPCCKKCCCQPCICKKCCLLSSGKTGSFLIPTSASIYAVYQGSVGTPSRRWIDGKLVEFGSILGYAPYWRDIVVKNGVECIQVSEYWSDRDIQIIEKFSL